MVAEGLNVLCIVHEIAVSFPGLGTESYCLSVTCLSWAHILNAWSQSMILILEVLKNTSMGLDRGSESPGACSWGSISPCPGICSAFLFAGCYSMSFCSLLVSPLYSKQDCLKPWSRRNLPSFQLFMSGTLSHEDKANTEVYFFDPKYLKSERVLYLQHISTKNR